MLPQAWRHGAFHPKVMYDLVMPREHDDHWPACVSSRLLCQGACADNPTVRPPRDLADLDELSQYALDFTWHSICDVPWRVSVHDHTRFIFDHVGSCLPILAARRPRRKRAFMSDLALDLVSFCRVLKRHLGFLEKEGRSLLLRVLFATWRCASQGHVPPQHLTSLGWTARDLHGIQALCVWSLRSARKSLRFQLAQAKATFAQRQLAKLARAGALHDAKAFYRALKPLRPPSKRVLKPFSALAIHPLEEGHAPTHEALQARAAAYFGDIEAGVPATPTFRLSDLPSLLEIQCLARRVPAGKAPGTSKIPNYCWNSRPDLVAQHLHPLLVKANVRLTEPIQFKDHIYRLLSIRHFGVRIFAWKGVIT